MAAFDAQKNSENNNSLKQELPSEKNAGMGAGPAFLAANLALSSVAGAMPPDPGTDAAQVHTEMTKEKMPEVTRYLKEMDEKVAQDEHYDLEKDEHFKILMQARLLPEIQLNQKDKTVKLTFMDAVTNEAMAGSKSASYALRYIVEKKLLPAQQKGKSLLGKGELEDLKKQIALDTFGLAKEFYEEVIDGKKIYKGITEARALLEEKNARGLINALVNGKNWIEDGPDDRVPTYLMEYHVKEGNVFTASVLKQAIIELTEKTATENPNKEPLSIIEIAKQLGISKEDFKKYLQKAPTL